MKAPPRIRLGSLALVASCALAGRAHGQEVLERVEVTGSAIKRIDAETAVPVTILRSEDFKKYGVTSVEQIMALVSAGQQQQGASLNVGTNTAGATFADLRGIGSDKTLVLLNGRRVANSAFGLTEGAAAVDLNVIPFAAIDRVEVLRDGASALYGTDAIGGVINFITKRQYAGWVLTAGADRPQHRGGAAYNGNLGFGAGDLEKDRFNVFGFVDYSRQEHIGGLDRNFNARIPSALSSTTFPANYYQGGSTGNVAATAPGGCAAFPGLVASGTTSCRIATAPYVDYTPTTERISGLLKGSWKLSDADELGFEYFAAQNRAVSEIAPVPHGGLYQNRTRPDGSLNPYYPGNPGGSVPSPDIPLSSTYMDSSGAETPGVLPGFVHVRFRDVPLGGRVDRPLVQQQRALVTTEGNSAGWDYQAGASWNQNISRDYISGYDNGDTISDGVLNGIINPYGAQSAAGAMLIANSGLAGLLQTATGEVYGVDAKVSHDFDDALHAGRPIALAIGLEGRREVYQDHANTGFAALVADGTGIDPNSVSRGARIVYASYAELNVPVLRSLDLTAATRYDHYSDFGGTLNPKFSLRLQPIRQLLVRGSYSTGFRAPSVFELHSSQSYVASSVLNDPIRCPNGVPAPGVSASTACAVQFQELTGGNPNLRPEKSRNATGGIVVEPVADLSVAFDYFWIRLREQIGGVPDTTVFANYQTFADLFHRLPDGSLSTDGHACTNPATCGYVDLRTSNSGILQTSGIDLTGSYRLRAGAAGTFTMATNTTYVIEYKQQTYTDGPYVQNVGVYVGGGPIFRWQSTVSVGWTYALFGLGSQVHYKSGYADENMNTISPAFNKVASYTTFDLFGSWAPSRSLALVAGVKNLFDREPPFSNQVDWFQGGYDPRFTDPTGRTFYGRATYSF